MHNHIRIRHQIKDAESLFNALLLVSKGEITDYEQLDFSQAKWHIRIHGAHYKNSLDATMMEALIYFQRYVETSYAFCKYWDRDKKYTSQDIKEFKGIELSFFITEGSFDAQALIQHFIDKIFEQMKGMSPKHKLIALLIVACAVLGVYCHNGYMDLEHQRMALQHDLEMRKIDSHNQNQLVELNKLAYEMATNTRRELFRASSDAESIEFGGKHYSKQEIIHEASQPNISAEKKPTIKIKRFEILSYSTRHTEIINSDLSKARKRKTTSYELELYPLDVDFPVSIKMNVSEKSLPSPDFFNHIESGVVYIQYSSIESNNAEESKINFHEFVTKEIYKYLRSHEKDVYSKDETKVVQASRVQERQLNLKFYD